MDSRLFEFPFVLSDVLFDSFYAAARKWNSSQFHTCSSHSDSIWSKNGKLYMVIYTSNWKSAVVNNLLLCPEYSTMRSTIRILQSLNLFFAAAKDLEFAIRNTNSALQKKSTVRLKVVVYIYTPNWKKTVFVFKT